MLVHTAKKAQSGEFKYIGEREEERGGGRKGTEGRMGGRKRIRVLSAAFHSALRAGRCHFRGTLFSIEGWSISNCCKRQDPSQYQDVPTEAERSVLLTMSHLKNMFPVSFVCETIHTCVGTVAH